MARSTDSLWQDSISSRRWPALDRDLEVDVAIVGAGITGLTAAVRLIRAGKRVALLDMHEVAGGETSHTTAHLTEVIDTRYHVLESKFGREGSRLAAESSHAAIQDILELTQTLRIDCAWSRVPAYLYAEDEEGAHELEREVAAAKRAGLVASLTRDVPLPFPVQQAMLVANQAQFHPLAYLVPVAEWLAAQGVLLFEDTRVENVVDGEPCRVVAARGFTVRAKDVIVAANVPVNNRFFFHTSNFPYRTYAIAGRVGRFPPPGLYWDTADPYHYTRLQGDHLIVGGEDHKVGAEEDTPAAYARLEEYARAKFGLESVEYRWSGQVIEPTDGLPFIGRNPACEHVHVATGYSGNGMTFGTLAARILSDGIVGLANPYAELYSASRVKPLAGAKEFLAENVDFPAHFVADRLRGAEGSSTADVARGEGKILSLRHRKVAVFRDEGGQCHAVSPVCTHMACHVRFNTAEKSWDCPCHGGRFSVRGEVLNGPAVKPLKAMDQFLPEEERADRKEPTTSALEEPTSHANK